MRRPPNEWQACEDARVDRHKFRIDQLRSLAKVEWLFALGIRMKIETTEAVVIDAGFEEFEAQARR